MRYKIKLTAKARKSFLSLEKDTQKKIAKKLRYYISHKNPINYAKKLKEERLGTYRFRIGNYRAIFDIDKHKNIIILLILTIKHRKNIYL